MSTQTTLAAWLDQPPLAVTPLHKGTTSNACLVETADGSYILRRVSREAAEVEYAASRLLDDAGMAARILPTRTGQGWMEQDGACFNLQRRIVGTAIRSCDADTFRAAGCALGCMHMALSGCRDTGVQDRFSLSALLTRAMSRHPFLKTQNPEAQTLHQLAARLRPLEDAQVQLIHGDLGVWNMLRTRDGVAFIDFGEARQGHPYMDIAAAVISRLSLEQDEMRLASDASLFLDSYASEAGPVNRPLLTEYMNLWQLRGVLAEMVYRTDVDQGLAFLAEGLAALRRYALLMT